jgi:cellulose synthase/poly-beta-1,6-N-acetylglucosamine synthase-like glycosyltransferase
LNPTINILLWIMACVVSAPLWVLIAQSLLGFLPARSRAHGDQATPALAVLVPAHNEEPVIGATLDSLKAALPDGGRIVVIADNCSDRTSDIVREHGVEVLEREDTTNRGKGFALDCGLEVLKSDPPEVLVIVDADCEVSPTTLTDLARAAQHTGRPVQGVYLLRAPDKRDAKAVVSAFAFMVKNQARPRGMDLLGLPIPLTGSGMAFPYALIKQANLATGNIVEDLALGLELAEQGHGPVLCDAAHITGSLPDAGDAAVTQRTRWEHGYLSTLLSTAPRLFVKGVFKLRPTLIAAAVDLAVPPLSLLVIGALAALVAAGVIGWWFAVFGPAVLIAGSLALAGLILIGNWLVYARTWLPLGAALAIPGYILWKLPIYLKFLKGREKSWVRTDRGQGPADNGTSGG